VLSLMPSQQRDLFGGAIVFKIPPEFRDVSELRQVPDSQEVFLHPDTSISIVVEVLERVTQDEDEEAAKFHFDSLAHDNSAISSSVESIAKNWNDTEGETPSPTVLKGAQLVCKFNSKESHKICILLAVFRVESKKIDLVLSMNIPPDIAEGGAGHIEYQRAQSDFEIAVKSLQIIDFGLFV